MQKRIPLVPETPATKLPSISFNEESSTLKKINYVPNVSEMVKTSNYFKNLVHLRKRNPNLLNSGANSPTAPHAKKDEENFTNGFDSAVRKVNQVVFGPDSDRQLIMNHEIGLELRAQALQRMIAAKKQKHAEIVLKNNGLIQQINIIEEQLRILKEEKKKRNVSRPANSPRKTETQHTLCSVFFIKFMRN